MVKIEKNEKGIITDWLTADNVAGILQKHNCPLDVDYISIDIDNMDYWILKSVLEGGYKSNLLVLEFNPIWNFDESFAKIYNENARKKDSETDASSNYGASLRAFQNLLIKYDYRLVHVTKNNAFGDVSCNNAIFLQERFDINDIFKDQQKTIENVFGVSYVETYKKPGNKRKFKTDDIVKIKDIMKHNSWVEV